MSLIAACGIILGEPADMLGDFSLLDAQGYIRANHRISLIEIPGSWRGPEVTAGQQSEYLLTGQLIGHVIRFVGHGQGDLHAYEGSAQRYVGPITAGSWAYVPAGELWYFYTCFIGALTLESTMVQRA